MLNFMLEVSVNSPYITLLIFLLSTIGVVGLILLLFAWRIDK